MPLLRLMHYAATADGCILKIRLSVGKTSSTLGASSLENFSTVSGCHSFSETVFLFSLSFLRLIGSFHDLHLLKRY